MLGSRVKVYTLESGKGSDIMQVHIGPKFLSTGAAETFKIMIAETNYDYVKKKKR